MACTVWKQRGGELFLSNPNAQAVVSNGIQAVKLWFCCLDHSKCVNSISFNSKGQTRLNSLNSRHSSVPWGSSVVSQRSRATSGRVYVQGLPGGNTTQSAAAAASPSPVVTATFIHATVFKLKIYLPVTLESKPSHQYLNIQFQWLFSRSSWITQPTVSKCWHKHK